MTRNTHGTVNEVHIIGLLGRDIEAHSTASRTPVTTLSICTKTSWEGANSEQREQTEWHRVVAWGKVASSCAAHLTKGRRVDVFGSLQYTRWTDADGQTRYGVDIRAERVVFLDSPAPQQAEEPLPFVEPDLEPAPKPRQRRKKAA